MPRRLACYRTSQRLPCTCGGREDEGARAGEISDLVRLRRGGDAKSYQIRSSDNTFQITKPQHDFESKSVENDTRLSLDLEIRFIEHADLTISVTPCL